MANHNLPRPADRRWNRRWAAYVLPWLLLLAACDGLGPPTPPPTPIISNVTPSPAGTPHPAAGGRIAWVRASADGTRRDLWVMRADGTGAQQFPLASQVDSLPVWAPDGGRIVYQNAQDGKDQLYVVAVKADNTPGDTIWLTAARKDQDNTLPAWSPDGTQIVFQSGSGADFQLYTVPAAGTGVPQPIANLPPYAGAPSWAPDGRKIAFSGGASAQVGREIYTTPPAGGPALRLTGNERNAYFPRWAPDGTALLFSALPAGSDRKDIYRVTADGQGQQALAATDGEDTGGVWSPDGQWVAYFSNTSRDNEVYVVPATGGPAVNVSNYPLGDIYPSWAADNYHLVFSSNRDGAYRLYLVGRDGAGLRPLTTGDGTWNDNFPAWTP